jgi:FAD synthetase
LQGYQPRRSGLIVQVGFNCNCMKKVLSINDAIKTSKELRYKNKTVVLVGGFFDILHKGHIEFLKRARKCGDYLFVLLEDDKKAKQIKGSKRPVNSQEKRASILSSVPDVDFVVLLNNMTDNSQYDRLIFEIAPNIIAATQSDPNMIHKKRQAGIINAKVVSVIKRITKYSTTSLAKNI